MHSAQWRPVPHLSSNDDPTPATPAGSYLITPDFSRSSVHAMAGSVYPTEASQCTEAQRNIESASQNSKPQTHRRVLVESSSYAKPQKIRATSGLKRGRWCAQPPTLSLTPVPPTSPPFSLLSLSSSFGPSPHASPAHLLTRSPPQPPSLPPLDRPSSIIQIQ